MEAAQGVSRLPDEQRFRAFSELALKLILDSDASAMKELVDYLLTKEVLNTFSRTFILNDLIVEMCSKIKDVDGQLDANLELDDAVPVARALVGHLRPKSDEFAEAYYAAVDLLAAVYQGLEMWQQAAETKSGFSFAAFGGKLSVPVLEQFEWVVDAAGFYLKPGVDQPSTAYQALVQRATPQLKLVREAAASSAAARPRVAGALFRYDVCFAQAAERLGKYPDAAAKYLEVASTADVSLAKAQAALLSASYCVVSSAASPQRSRLLARLCADPRAAQLPTYPLLQRLRDGKVVDAAQVAALEALPGCPAYLKAVGTSLSAGAGAGIGEAAAAASVLCLALREHNVTAAARVFATASLARLATLLLGATPAETRALVASLAARGLVRASVDDAGGYVHFGASGEGAGAAAGAATAPQELPLNAWQSRVGELCQEVAAVVDGIAAVR
jgi:hypothetical protein